MVDEVKTIETLEWSCHTPNLLREVLNNPTCGILKVPINILGKLLYLVGERASELNDPELNQLMLRLALYEIAYPQSKVSDMEFVKAYEDEPKKP